MHVKDVIAVLEELGVSKSSNVGSQLSCECPLAKWFHKGGTDSRPSMSIKIGEGVSLFTCFSCGESGTLFQLVDSYSRLSGKPLGNLISYVKDIETPSLSMALAKAMHSSKHGQPLKTNAKVLNENLLSVFFCATEVPQALSYLQSRGVSEGTIKEFEIKFDSRNHRIVFPIRNQTGGLVGAVGRSLIDNGPKYYNYFGFEAAKCLGGVHRIKDNFNRVLLVEGMFDVLRASVSECQTNAQAVCTFKAEASNEQCSQLIGLAKSILICYDGDMAGYKGSEKTFARLKRKVPFLRCIKMPECADVGSLSSEEFIELLQKNGVSHE